MPGISARLRLDRPDFSLNVDMTLPAQGVTAVFGRSGAGKTTLLRCIAGLERAVQGDLSVNGEVWQDSTQRLPIHKRPLGYVFQEASLFPHLTVAGNLDYGLRRTRSSHRVSLDNAVELLGISRLLDRMPAHLSGGERQRVSIARALAVSPRLLLMDEPLAGVDVQRKQEIMPYLERLHDELKIPVIFVTHSVEEVARLADYLVIMDNGQVTASGPLSEILSSIDPNVQIGEEAGTVIEAAVGAIDNEWNLVRVDFDGGSIWAPDKGLSAGRPVRVHIMARDVSLAKEPGITSIQNVLRGSIDAIGEDKHPGIALVRVRIGSAMILARLTKRSAALLELTPGVEIWVQVKSVALVE